MSTPERQSTSAAAETPGWGKALFGLFSTQKPARPVQAGTNPTHSVTRSVRGHRRELDLNGPSEQEAPRFGGQNGFVTSSMDLLDSQGEAERSVETPEEPSLSSFAKSPWTSPSAGAASTLNGSVPAFSFGTLKPSADSRLSLSNRQAGVSTTARRRRYKASTLLTPKRRKTGPINPTHAVNALMQSQSIFQPTSRQLEVRNNYTGFRAGRGKRLLGSTQIAGSRLPPLQDSSEEHQPASPRDEPATKRRKQVNFGPGVDVTPLKEKMVTPIESAMMTPAGAKRKATPYKLPPAETVDDDDSSMASPPPIIPQRRTVPASVGLLAPTGSFKPILPATGSRQQPKLLLEMDDLAFCQPSEAKPLGTPCAARRPPLASSALFSIGNSRDVAFDVKPKYLDPKPIVASDTSSIKKTLDSANPKNENELATVASGWGDMFKEQATQWKCEVCGCRNDPKEIKCPSCETPRSGKEMEVAAADNQSSIVSTGSIGAGGFSFAAAPVAKVGPTTKGSVGPGGFSFTSTPAPAAASSGPAVSFGTASTVSAPAPSSGMGGFKFGTDVAPASRPPIGSGGFTFGATVIPPAKDSKHETPNNTHNGHVLLFGSTPVPAPVDAARGPTPSLSFASSSSTKKDETKAGGFALSHTSAPAPAGGEKQPFKFTVGVQQKDDHPKTTFDLTPASKPSTTIPTTEPVTKRSLHGDSNSYPSSADKASDDADRAKRPVFNFGGSSSSANTGFQFGSKTSTDTFSSTAPALGSIPITDSADEDHSKRRRGGNNESSSVPIPSFGAPAPPSASGTPAFSFSNSSAPATAPAVPLSVGAQPAKDAATPALGSFSFGSTSETTLGPTASIPLVAFGASGDSSEDKAFGSAATSGFSFGGTPAMAPSAPSFLSTPAAPVPAAPVPAPSTGMFGATPASAAPPTGFSFNSTAAPTPTPGGFGTTPAPSLGSTPAHAPPAVAGFGATPAPAFGSTPAQAPPALASFGSTPAPAFGSTPARAAPAPGGFGSTPAPSFGSTPAPAAPAPGGFGSAVASTLPAFGSTPLPSFGSAPAPVMAPAFGGAGPGGNFGAPPAGSFVTAPASFGAPVSGGFSAPAPFGAPTPGGFGAPAPQVGGFGGGFGAPPPASVDPGGFGNGGFGAATGGAAPQFSLGTGGGASRGAAGGRRIIKARRPRRA